MNLFKTLIARRFALFTIAFGIEGMLDHLMMNVQLAACLFK